MTTDEQRKAAINGAGVVTPEEPKVAAWERRMQWPLVVAAVGFLVSYSWQVLAPNATPESAEAVSVLMWVIWALFAIDYAVRLVLARRKLRFIGKHVLDLIIVVLPALQQLRLLRVLTVLFLLNRVATGSVRRNVGIYTGGSVILLGYCAALAILEAERNAPGASITSFDNALWWTITTVTTVGYGDYSPVTGHGKLIAAGLMLGGIALLGVVTASIASWFVEHIQGVEESWEASQREDAAIRKELSMVRAELAELRAHLGQTQRTEDGQQPASSGE